MLNCTGMEGRSLKSSQSQAKKGSLKEVFKSLLCGIRDAPEEGLGNVPEQCLSILMPTAVL